MRWQGWVRALLEPAKDPLRDSFGVSVERVRILRNQLQRQLTDLQALGGPASDPAFDRQIRELRAEHDRLLQIEQKVAGEMDAHQARRQLLDARQTAAQAQERLEDLLLALDAAHARAEALAESARRGSM